MGRNSSFQTNNKKFFTESDYYRILASDKEVLITVTNLQADNFNYTKFINIRNHSYESFIEYMCASASYSPFMNICTIDGIQYCDGGVAENTPLKKVLDFTNSVDIFIHDIDRSKNEQVIKTKVNNSLHLIGRLLNIMRKEIQRTDISIFEKNQPDEYNINYYYIPTDFNLHPLVFDKLKMKQLAEYGKSIDHIK